uniref:Type II toxin-antitoxin system RelE/ParE family toxin n=2 Tax=Candidatus Bipolaricaulota TaxID=67810 RepID=H5S9W9_9BACT|nr:hypothetical protein HGMM_F03H09C14 [uncultured Acetothermia bacterium]BAL59223.1 hypothetical conserved protein [Candidatus Acetothermum autotrophicum]
MWQVRLAQRSQRQLRRLDPLQQQRVLKALSELERDPLSPRKRIKRLQTPRGVLYRLRVGGYRIIYELSSGFVDVLGIVSRAELERFLKGL